MLIKFNAVIIMDYLDINHGKKPARKTFDII